MMDDQGFTEFPCKSCGERICLGVQYLSGMDFIQVVCAECSSKERYSLVRMDAIEEKC